jgi:hypothetical protein
MRVRRENKERLTTDLKKLNRDYTAKKSHQSNLPTQPRNLTSPICLQSQEISPVQFTYTAKKSHQSNLSTQPRNLNSPIYLHSQEISPVQFRHTQVYLKLISYCLYTLIQIHNFYSNPTIHSYFSIQINYCLIYKLHEIIKKIYDSKHNFTY